MPWGERRIYSSSRQVLGSAAFRTLRGLPNNENWPGWEPCERGTSVGEEIVSGRGDISPLLDEGMFSIIALKLQWFLTPLVFYLKPICVISIPPSSPLLSPLLHRHLPCVTSGPAGLASRSWRV